MPPNHRDALGEVCYNIWLDAFDDSLQLSRPRPRKVRLVASEFLSYQWTETESEVKRNWNARLDSWRLPTAHETDLRDWDSDHHCVWVGWFVPRLYIPFNERQMHSRRGRDIKRGKCVINCTAEPLNPSTVSKAFKAVYKIDSISNNKLFDLYSPDEAGVCKAISIPGGMSSVLFFAEWRDDTEIGYAVRQKSWLRKVTAFSLAETSNSTPENPAQLRRSERVRQSFDYELSISDESSIDDDLHESDSDYSFTGSESSKSGDLSESDGTDGELRTFEHQEEDEGDEKHTNKEIAHDDIIYRPFQAYNPSLVHSHEESALYSRLSSGSRASNMIKATSEAMPDSPNRLLVTLRVPNAAVRRAELEQRSRGPHRTPTTAAHTNLSRLHAKKRQIGQPASSEFGPRIKRSRSSHQAPMGLKRIEGRNIKDVIQVKTKMEHDSDDEVQFIGEVSIPQSRGNNIAMAAPATPSPSESAAFILDFIAADKIAKVARLQDAFSRRATLKAFRRHLTSTSEADSDALAHNIAENEDEVTRIMLAETLVAVLKEKMAVVIKVHSRGK
ncbi:hypothetical protein ColLi_01022 [Colletotrichum liriopes]|uniref:Uncharacterized protein n=1 Tax=Colletotrichum liriopes TaxID=708192 RepID=A0AA37GCI6_9PEZI|nr:hypothetical protein ColLi_01022 [Colletotrichum liriopes]